jgi:hypothetical protein
MKEAALADMGLEHWRSKTQDAALGMHENATTFEGGQGYCVFN